MERFYKRLRWGCCLCGVLAAFSAQAGDPLDDVSGTEEWDQVVPAAGQTSAEPVPRDDFRQQVEDWNGIRLQWHEEREKFFQERSRLGKLKRPQNTVSPQAASSQTASPPVYSHPTPAAAAPKQTTEDWGDRGEGSWYSSPAIDKAIDEELGESRPPPPPRAPAPVTAVPQPAQPAPSPEKISPFSSAQDKALEEMKSAPPPPPPPALPPPEADFPPIEPAARVRAADDEAAGAAAAAALLKQLEEERRKEQEAIRKKAKLEEDEEGQVVDPELQKEMSDDKEP